MEEQDTDCDQKITSQDQGSRRFRFKLHEQPYELTGSYVLSNLLQELSIALDSGSPPRLDRVMEDPIKRTSRLIRTQYWQQLSRSIDEDGIIRVLDDAKIAHQSQRTLYVPPDDNAALDYFEKVGLHYNSTYERLRHATSALPFVELLEQSATDEGGRVLVAMLRTSEGRSTLQDFSSRLRSIAASMDYPALTAELGDALSEVDRLLEQAERSCVHLSTLRLSRVAERTARALSSFSFKQMAVRRLPKPKSWPQWVSSLGRDHGPLSLALRHDPKRGTLGVPFVVPGGRFNEMYGWDSYFIVLGLIADGHLDLATSMVDNFVYSITHYGATLNANRTYYLTRSQPPLFTSMIRAVWEATPADQRHVAWLEVALAAAMREYNQVWAEGQHPIASLCDGTGKSKVCLARYEGRGKGQPPEVEKGHFDWLWQQMGRSMERSYARGELKSRDLTAELDSAFRHDRCMRESGHDTTYRWFREEKDPGGEMLKVNRCADMATVDLNSLLYKYEVDIAHLLRTVQRARSAAPRVPPKGSTPAPVDPGIWCARAKARFGLMKRHLWSAQDGLFYDAFVTEAGTVHTQYVSATTLYPLWATTQPCYEGAHSAPGLTAEEKSALITNALEGLEAPGGLLSTARASRDRFSRTADRQWEYPNGWAPHQILAWQGLAAHGFEQDAQRLAFAWLYTLLVNVIDFNGTIPEKYDVVERTHAVFSEYGNVGTEFDYIANEGFGWMNASFQIGVSLLTPAERRRLGQAVAKR